MAAAEPGRIVLVLGGPIALADVASLCARVRAALLRSGAELVVCDVRALEADLGAIEALARLQLTARRLGGRVVLRDVPRELHALLALTGICDEVLGVEPGRQAEEREHRLGVEEERELDDPGR